MKVYVIKNRDSFYLSSIDPVRFTQNVNNAVVLMSFHAAERVARELNTSLFCNNVFDCVFADSVVLSRYGDVPVHLGVNHGTDS